MKKLIAVVLVFGLVLGLILPIFYTVYGEELDQNALNLFLNKIANMDNEERELGAALLSEYIALGNEGVDQLKDSIGSLISESQKSILENEGYTVDDIKNELDRLKSWSMEDRYLLVDYTRQGNTTKLDQLIKLNEVMDSQTPVIGDSTVEKGKEEIKKPISFNDVENHWAKDNILFMAEKGIINGKGQGKFAPEDNITRAEFAAMIVRLFGLNTEESLENTFSDISKGDWYYDVALISHKDGIITGKGNNKFAPLDNITREEMAVMTIRALELLNLSPKMSKLMIDNELVVFSDRSEVSSWAIESFGKSVNAGIITGKTYNKLSPKSHANRAEAATILMRLYHLINK